MVYLKALFFFCMILFFACVTLHRPLPAFATGEQNLTEAELIEIGRRVYREGLQANTKPVRATVMGDIEVVGTQFTCINCHRRSGLGGEEGTKYVLATNGPLLYTPRQDIYLKRPAYTDQTLIEALALGENPMGKSFDPIMPVYDLPDLEMDGLIAYLKTLSNEYSPGMDENDIHIATVIDNSVSSLERNAMLDVIEEFFTVKNAGTRKEKRRAAHGPFYQEYRNKAYRNWVLHIWELKGPRDSWPEQLADYYHRQPVFAMFSGLVNTSWEPIHRFCEENQIPSLLPNTDLPVTGETANFYTLYYSKGLTLEVEVALEDIEKDSTGQTVLQSYRQGSSGAQAAQIFNSLRDPKLTTVHDLPFKDKTAAPNWATLIEETRRNDADVLILWLSADELAKIIKPDTDSSFKDLRIYVSSSLLNGELAAIPAQLKQNASLLHPFNLPEKHATRFRRAEVWLKSRGIPLTSPLIQGQTFFACLLLSEGLMHIRRYFYRDYLMDMIDHTQRMEAYVTNYPRISFGPEQRYLAKGAYIIDLQSNKARWVVPYH
jgi:hypothetical protein